MAFSYEQQLLENEKKKVKVNACYETVNENRMLNHYFILQIKKEMKARG